MGRALRGCPWLPCLVSHACGPTPRGGLRAWFLFLFFQVRCSFLLSLHFRDVAELASHWRGSCGPPFGATLAPPLSRKLGPAFRAHAMLRRERLPDQDVRATSGYAPVDPHGELHDLGIVLDHLVRNEQIEQRLEAVVDIGSPAGQP